MDRARRGTWAVSSVNVRRGHRHPSQKNLRLAQTTSTGPATGMSRTLGPAGMHAGANDATARAAGLGGAPSLPMPSAPPDEGHTGGN